jgi:hypothetical protein
MEAVWGRDGRPTRTAPGCCSCPAKDKPLARLVFLFFLLAAGFLPVRADDYVDGLVRRAQELRLHEEPTWINLLHYRRSWSGLKSIVDDPKFFLARDGATNPRGELEADLRAFFDTPASETNHPVCRFVARFDWLDRQLQFDRSRLPVQDCAKYREVYDYLQPDTVALVFPSAYMNSPASMFGHTLLVFDSKDKNRMLSRAVSYAARTRETIGPVFAFAGIFGFYPGYYAYQPYYEKVEQYGDIGHRDVWEYELDMTQDEIDFMLRHAWELQGIYSWYYFFDENCAFNLYYFLDVARPSLQLTRRMPWFVIPIDTVKAVDRKGLVRAVHYRPSTVSKIKHKAALLSPEEGALAIAVARGQKPAGEVEGRVPGQGRQAAVLDLAAEYTQYLYTEEEIPRDTYNARLLPLLRTRSKLGRADSAMEAIPAPERPDQGHAPGKIALGAGVADGEGYGSMRYRIAYHALADNNAGYDPGAQIQFLNTEARVDGDGWRLQTLDLVDVFSLAPRDGFFRPGSWKFRGGLTQEDFEKGADDLMWYANTGAGLTWAPGPLDLAYMMVDAEPQLGDGYRDGYAVGLGPSAGLMAHVGRNWKHLLEAKSLWFGIGDDLWRSTVAWSQDLRLRRDLSLALDTAWNHRDNRSYADVQIRLNWYF